MKEYHEHRIELGFDRKPKAIFDEVEQYSARFFRDGWQLERGVVDDSMGFIDLIFYREIDLDSLEGAD